MMRTRVRDWLLRLCFALIRWLQDEPAQTLQPGDVVWCRMPLAQGQLENIPAAHQIRPYVVCQEDEQGIQGNVQQAAQDDAHAGLPRATDAAD